MGGGKSQFYVSRRINAGVGSNGYIRDAPIAFEMAGFASTDPYTSSGVDNGQVGIIQGWHDRAAKGNGQLAGIGVVSYAMSNIG